MKRLVMLVVPALVSCVSLDQHQWGIFTGTVQTEWLDDGRRMRLLAPFRYTDPSGAAWDAPAASVVDGASIPQFAWSFIGGPFEGKYRAASVIHDVACERRDRDWYQVHRAFYTAMLASAVDPAEAKVMYAAVYYFGPRWVTTVRLPPVPAEELQSRLRTIESAVGVHNRVVVTRPGRAVIARRGIAGLGGRKTETVGVVAEVRPEVQTLPLSSFAELRKAIEERGMSLAGIEAFVPGTVPP